MEYDHVLDAIIFGKVDDTEPPPDLRSSSGTLTVKSTLDAQDIDAVSLDLATTLTASGLITADAGVTAGAGQHITVSSTGRFKHGLRTLMVSAVEGHQFGVIGSATASFGVTGVVSSSTGLASPWILPVTLDAGKRVLAIRVVVEDSVGNTVASEFWKIAHNVGGGSIGAQTQIGPTIGPSDQTGNIQVQAITGLTETISTGFNYVVLVSSAGGGYAAVVGMELDYDEP